MTLHLLLSAHMYNNNISVLFWYCCPLQPIIIGYVNSVQKSYFQFELFTVLMITTLFKG